jgi:hypothetical protein
MKNQALMSLTEARINTNDQLAKYVENAKSITIPLFPETVQFTDDALKYGAAIVSVDLNLDNYGNNRDIYRNESGGYCLHLTKLNEIAQQSGLQVIESRVLERKTDERGVVTYIEHQVKWKMRSVDGSIKEGTATGKYDYFRDCEKYIKPTEKDKYGNVKGEAQVKSRRNYAEALAESNALTRAYNKAIAKLPQSFTLEELKKPFLIPYVIEDKNELLKDLPKEDQLAIRKELARKRLNLTDTIYQSSPTQTKQVEDAVVTEVVEPEEVKQPEKKVLSPEEVNHIQAETFLQPEVKQEERTQMILKLIKIKGYKDPNNIAITEKRIENQSKESQVNFIEKLLNLPDENESAPL